MTITTTTAGPHETLALKQFIDALQSAKASTLTALRGVSFFRQPETESLIGARTAYRDTENVWHDLTLKFHDQPDGGRKLTPTEETTQADSTPEYQAAIKQLSQIIRSAIGFYRIKITAAADQGDDLRNAHHRILAALSAVTARHLDSAGPAVVLNGTQAPEA